MISPTSINIIPEALLVHVLIRSSLSNKSTASPTTTESIKFHHKQTAPYCLYHINIGHTTKKLYIKEILKTELLGIIMEIYYPLII